MKKWYDEEYKWTIEVIGYLRGDKTEGLCRNGEEIGGESKYEKTVVCPDGCVIFKMTAVPTGAKNFHTGGFYEKA